MFTLGKLLVQEESFPIGERLPLWGRRTLVFMGKTKARIERRFFLREWAKAKDKRQRDVVAATGLNKGYVSLLWSDQKEPSPDALARIAAALGVRPPAVLMIHPFLAEARAVAAVAQLPKDQQEIAVRMLEGLVDKRRT